MPSKKITDSGIIKDQPKQLEAKAKNLSKKKAAIKDKLNKLQKELQSQAKEIQSQEQGLRKINQEVSTISGDIKAQKAQLKKEQEHIASLITSLVKMNAIPLETLILAPPEQSRELIISYHALKALHPELAQQAEKLEKQITTLEKEKKSLSYAKAEKAKKATKLKEKKTGISKLVAARQKEHKKTELAYKQAQEKANLASKHAKDLNELIQTVKKKNIEIEKQEAVKVTKAAPQAYSLSKTKRLPVSGQITTAYGQKDKIGATSKGVRIKTVSGALVVAPKQGTVKYAGDFRKYGRIILVEHAKNYHSLIAGLDKIDTVVGQRVKEGEPIGALKTTQSTKNSVYYELRLNGKPVNPMSHLSRL
jgi:septal ring factor EnvC (AmiA/AmiB activator)